jgi:hypothetical protein
MGETQMTMINKTIRAKIKDYAESRDCKYRITATGEVHLYGKMPNSIETGWWLFAHNIPEAMERICA